ncbi:PREDICTED: uncharacterized protein LOC101619714 isoform X1 [Condylura cristata]|uniref:uncharacterized protein LOC101619714 isoform X1 n=1 Tax=Condylura cristata TaxID=143302 RepID=UPI0006429EAA|nr:PREDICTED: uncharacterized protein LOC101619714 isoform X1 [Condylura cristata]
MHRRVGLGQCSSSSHCSCVIFSDTPALRCPGPPGSVAAGLPRQVCASCGWTPSSAFSPSSAPPTTTLPASLAWLSGSARLSDLGSSSSMVSPTTPSPACRPWRVADCICLLALDKPEAVPVDVHVWQIAQRDYSWHPSASQAKGPSPPANKELGNFFRSLWGPYAGWAQAVLFSADLRQPRRAEEPPAKRRRRAQGPEG